MDNPMGNQEKGQPDLGAHSGWTSELRRIPRKGQQSHIEDAGRTGRTAFWICG